MYNRKWLWILMAVLLIAATGSGGLAVAQDTGPAAPLGPAFTYQGYLKDNSGEPLTDTCSFIFSLWDSLTGGIQVGGDSLASDLQVKDGYFTATVNSAGEFGPTAFNGEARWLEIEVMCAMLPSFITLAPRQPVTPAPYASYALSAGNAPWSGLLGVPAGFADGVDNDTAYSAGPGLFLADTTFSADTDFLQRRVVGSCGAGSSIRTVNPDGTVVCEPDDNTTYAAGTGLTLSGTTFNANTTYLQRRVASCAVGSGIRTVNEDGSVVCEADDNTTYSAGTGLTLSGTQFSINFAGSGGANTASRSDHNHWGQTWTGSGSTGLFLESLGGVYDNEAALIGYARASAGTGVQGFVGPVGSGAGMLVPTGVSGISVAPAAGWSNLTFGVYGSAVGDRAYGVYGTATYTGTTGIAEGTLGVGVFGEALAGGGTGVRGRGYNGVYGTSTVSNGNGVIGEANAGSVAYGVWGISSTGYAGYFNGAVYVNGNLSKSGGGFRIDHPQDPENQYLNHSFVESPEMKNLYDGIALLDANGEATITLPDWFEALNKDFRYQLTCLGGFAPVYIAQEIQDNAFKIAGGTPGLKVSWQVTGVRQDPWALANPIQVEQPKPEDQVGTYLYPQGYGLPETYSSDYARWQAYQEQLESQPAETVAPDRSFWVSP